MYPDNTCSSDTSKTLNQHNNIPALLSCDSFSLRSKDFGTLTLVDEFVYLAPLNWLASPKTLRVNGVAGECLFFGTWKSSFQGGRRFSSPATWLAGASLMTTALCGGDSSFSGAYLERTRFRYWFETSFNLLWSQNKLFLCIRWCQRLINHCCFRQGWSHQCITHSRNLI